jgi:hypothetical protein
MMSSKQEDPPEGERGSGGAAPPELGASGANQFAEASPPANRRPSPCGWRTSRCGRWSGRRRCRGTTSSRSATGWSRPAWTSTPPSSRPASSATSSGSCTRPHPRARAGAPRRAPRAAHGPPARLLRQRERGARPPARGLDTQPARALSRRRRPLTRAGTDVGGRAARGRLEQRRCREFLGLQPQLQSPDEPQQRKRVSLRQDHDPGRYKTQHPGEPSGGPEPRRRRRRRGRG